MSAAKHKTANKLTITIGATMLQGAKQALLSSSISTQSRAQRDSNPTSNITFLPCDKEEPCSNNQIVGAIVQQVRCEPLLQSIRSPFWRLEHREEFWPWPLVLPPQPLQLLHCITQIVQDDL